MLNLFKGFRLFQEEEKKKHDKEDPESYVKAVKKHLGVEKKVWLGMPILLSNVKLGHRFIREPTMFYVWDFDDDCVTLRNVPKLGDDEDEADSNEPDGDNEIDLDKTTIHGRIEVTIDIDDFFDLQKPQGMQPGGGGGPGITGGLL